MGPVWRMKDRGGWGAGPPGVRFGAGVHRKERVEVGEKEPGGSEKDD